jgi:very-short-patch-repair endonuclease
MPDWQPKNTLRARELRNAATPAERELWKHLSSSKLDGFKFSRQMPVGPFFCDFLCRGAGLAVEVDGYSHDLTREQDARRTAYLQQQGVRVIRFTNHDVLCNAEGVIAAIRQALSDRPTPDPSRRREGRS